MDAVCMGRQPGAIGNEVGDELDGEGGGSSGTWRHVFEFIYLLTLKHRNSSSTPRPSL